MENNTLEQTATETFVETVELTTETARKHPAALGKLNRVTAKASKVLADNGHDAKRFKRDYANGVATYVCKNCGLAALAVASEGRGESNASGDAPTTKCSVVNS